MLTPTCPVNTEAEESLRIFRLYGPNLLSEKDNQVNSDIYITVRISTAICVIKKKVFQ